MTILCWLVNALTAALTFASLIGYAVVYTVWLKRATSQNIVIGGAAGAAPPVLGWAAVTNSVDPNALLLFLIVFVWTPPHFWALAIARKDEYAKVGIPMLPVTHGVRIHPPAGVAVHHAAHRGDAHALRHRHERDSSISARRWSSTRCSSGTRGRCAASAPTCR
jgi:protoheme IX farnesyltransferase